MRYYFSRLFFCLISSLQKLGRCKGRKALKNMQEKRSLGERAELEVLQILTHALHHLAHGVHVRLNTMKSEMIRFHQFNPGSINNHSQSWF